MKATAADITPIWGKPNQPWISAGVTSRPAATEKPSVSSGVTVSPTPRSIEVSTMKMKNSGMPSRITRP